MKKRYFFILVFCTFLLGCINQPHEDRSVLNLFDSNRDFEFIPAENLENIERIIKLSETNYYGMSWAMDTRTDIMMVSEAVSMGKDMPSDYSTTNVQVFGIDELDIVKIDSEFGNKIYYLNGNKLNFINSFPVENLSIYNSINTEYGNGIYEYNNSVMVISHNKINVYDKEGNRMWNADLNSTYVDSRMENGIIYLILREHPVYPYIPRPIQICNGICRIIEIDYNNIFIPTDSNANTFYDIISIELETGEVIDKKAFMGTYSSNIYMSKNNIYISTYNSKSESEVMFYYLLEKGNDLISNNAMERLSYLQQLNISDRAKAVEFENLMNTLFYGLTPEERAELQNEIKKGYSNYISKYPERKEYTGILKIEYSEGNLDIKNSGKMPGRLLNQFSMDEHNNYLRTAFTFGTWDKSENGLVIFNEDMEEVSRISGLAHGERIYSVRFMGDKGYVVTFREIDPLFVFDLTDPVNPELKGELKIPGYSTYLHPIANNKLIGIGQEDWKMKISLFDVSDCENPIELDSFITEERWSEALYNHHAFLWNPNENFVILPMGNKNYIFEITNNIKIRKIMDENAVRNLYADNILYVLTRDKIGAYALSDFSLINEVFLETPKYDEVIIYR